jgi:hypothetical protein
MRGHTSPLHDFYAFWIYLKYILVVKLHLNIMRFIVYSLLSHLYAAALSSGH